jgi:hypothetical protein
VGEFSTDVLGRGLVRQFDGFRHKRREGVLELVTLANL